MDISVFNKCYSAFLLFLLKLPIVTCFNFDVQNSIVIKGDSGSYFGYSVAFHESNGTARLLIGAPNKSKHQQYEGAVYQCLQNQTWFNCNEIPLELQSEDHLKWLGATLVSKKGTILVCAPLTGEYFTGKCFYSQGNMEQLELYLPGEETDLEMCGVGFSAALSKEATRFYTGAPSCRNGAGRLFASSTVPDESDDSVLSTDPSHFGYAIAIGNVLNDGSEGLIASVGFHGYSNFSGRVVIVDSMKQGRMIIRGSLSGHQPGEMFGASLSVSDLNGDGRDDVIIGAPHYTDYSSARLNYEIGAVYIYYKSPIEEYHDYNHQILKGKSSGGRFGYATAALDADGDGFNDLIVGAPYEASVYIFQGSLAGVRSVPSQRIRGNEFTPEISSFGFALASGDASGTGLAVGAYQSDAVVFIRTRPVVRISANIVFSPNNFSMEHRECQVEQSFVSCSRMRSCLSYTGKDVPMVIDAQLSISLDYSNRPQNKRLFFLETSLSEKHQNLRLKLEEERCSEELVYLRSKTHDRVTPIKIELMSKILSSYDDERPAPILDIYEFNGNVSKLVFIEDWKKNQTCDQDLQINVEKNFDTHIQGSRERLIIDIKVLNSGKYDLNVEIDLLTPTSMVFLMVNRNETNSTVFCYPTILPDMSSHLRCNLSNILQPRAIVNLRAVFKLEPSNLDKVIAFSAAVKGFDAEVPGCVASSSTIESITGRSNASLALMGWTAAERVTLNKSGPTSFTQYYQVRNLGPSDVLETEITISMLKKTSEGDFSVELIDASTEMGSDVVCRQVKHSLSADQELTLNCITGRLIYPKSDRVIIKFSCQLLSTGVFSQDRINNPNPINLVSWVTAKAIRLLHDQDPSSIAPVRSSLILKIKQDFEKTSMMTFLQATPIWVFLVSATLALIVLIIITLILCKCRFFGKRGSYKLAYPDDGTVIANE